MKRLILNLLAPLWGVAAIGSSLLSLPAQAEPLPQYAEHKHLGVATCGNSTCHAVNRLAEPSNVLQNEYLTWLFHDRHAGAYKTLLGAESKSIAAKLGLPKAETAAICLDCHADNVPIEKRGPEFHITDGVGCEACHGGAEKWVTSHTIKPYDLERNINQGMYPIASPAQRTKLCVSCHIGDENKLASHSIMGAGHPRLSFELDTFTLRQPEHYQVDEDYVERKNADTSILRLLVGTAVQAQQVAKNLSSSLVDAGRDHPEIALFDCHSCHHSLTDLKWQKRPNTRGLKPGAVRVNDSAFILLSAFLGAIDTKLQSKTHDAIFELHVSSSQSVEALQSKAKQLLMLAERAESLFLGSDIGEQQRKLMLNLVIELGIRGEYRDYVAAEQAVMAMDVLSYSLDEDEALSKLVDLAYRYTKDDESYKPQKFQKALLNYARR